MEEPIAKVEEINGQLVLNDPVGAAMVRAVGKHNCIGTMECQIDRVSHFERRMMQRGDSPNDVVIVLINVDDTELSGWLADRLVPSQDWQAMRDEGEIPFARGLAGREGIQEVLDSFDQDAAKKLLVETEGEVVVVVFDHGVAQVFTL